MECESLDDVLRKTGKRVGNVKSLPIEGSTLAVMHEAPTGFMLIKNHYSKFAKTLQKIWNMLMIFLDIQNLLLIINFIIFFKLEYTTVDM